MGHFDSFLPSGARFQTMLTELSWLTFQTHALTQAHRGESVIPVQGAL